MALVFSENVRKSRFVEYFFGCLSGVKSGSFFVCRKLKITDILTRRCFELPTGLKFCFSVTCMMS